MSDDVRNIFGESKDSGNAIYPGDDRGRDYLEAPLLGAVVEREMPR